MQIREVARNCRDEMSERIVFRNQHVISALFID
jgi:hypothetical protein